MWEEGEGTSQGTCVNHPRTWARESGLTVGAEGGLGGREPRRGGIGTTV